MARVVEVKIEGGREIIEALEARPLRAAKAIMRAALRSAATIWLQEMKAKVPKHTRFLAEHLRATFSVRGDELEGSAKIGPSTENYPRHGRTIQASSVARFLEYGTSKMTAEPFMRPAFESKKEEVLARFIEKARELLDREMGK